MGGGTGPRLRSAGVRTGVITNQSGVARGLLTGDQVAAVNARLSTLLGPFDTVQVCEHGPADGCGCRKPAPGLVHQACADLGIDPRHCAVVGDIGADVGAAVAAGARAVLVPTAVTRPEEVAAARAVAPDLLAAVELALARERPMSEERARREREGSQRERGATAADRPALAPDGLSTERARRRWR